MASIRLGSLCRSFSAYSRALPRSYSSAVGSNKPVLTLFTKKNEHCTLCEAAKEKLMEFSTQFVYEECYIDEPSNEAWFEKYKYDIPVIHINGEYLMKHRVHEHLLKKTLDNLNSK